MAKMGFFNKSHDVANIDIKQGNAKHDIPATPCQITASSE